MKRVICLLISVLFVFSLVSCKSDTKNQKKTTPEEEILDLTPKGIDLQTLVGAYTDKNNNNISAVILETADSKAIEITVGIENGDSTERYYMTAFNKDGKFSYTDERKCIEKGSEVTTVYENKKGYFKTDKNNSFYWKGANEKKCRNIVLKLDKEGENRAK